MKNRNIKRGFEIVIMFDASKQLSVVGGQSSVVKIYDMFSARILNVIINDSEILIQTSRFLHSHQIIILIFIRLGLYLNFAFFKPFRPGNDCNISRIFCCLHDCQA